MAKYLTCQVKVNDVTYYFTVEAYLAQCALMEATSMATASTNITYISVSTSGGIYNFTSTNTASSASVVSVKNYVTALEKILANPSLSKKDTVLWAKPTATLVSSPTTTVNISSTTSGTAKTIYNITTVEQGTPSTSNLRLVLHGHARGLIRTMSAANYKTLVENWKSCIRKTLGDIEITYSNEPTK